MQKIIKLSIVQKITLGFKLFGHLYMGLKLHHHDKKPKFKFIQEAV